jgi:large subunit ribosomal protein L10
MVRPTALARVGGDAAAAAKVLSDTARALRGPLEFKGGFMAGALLSPTDVETIARMPSREVLTGQLVGTIAAPLTGLVRTLNALISGLALQLGQIAEQGLVSGEAPADQEAPVAAETPAAEEAPVAEEAPAADAAPTQANEEPEADTAAEDAGDESEANSSTADDASPASEASAEEDSTQTEGSSDDAPSNE